MSNVTTFQVGKRTFVGGLFWQLLAGPVSSHDNEAATLAKQIGADLGTFRHGAMRQVGLCASSGQVKPGMASAAGVVSKSIELERLGNNALVATKLPDGRFLLVVIEQGEILPEGDEIGDESTINARLYSFFSQAQWDVVVAPHNWMVTGAQERDFLSFLPTNFAKGFGWWNLREVGAKAIRRRRNRILLGVVGASSALIAGAVGVSLWQKHQMEIDAKRIAEMVKSQADAEQQRLIAARKQKPWHKTPTAKDVAAACESSILSIPPSPGGWSRDSIVCDPATGVTLATYRRNLSKVGWLPEGFAVDMGGNIASYSVPVTGLNASQEAAMSPAAARKLLQAQLQAIGSAGALAEIPPPPLPKDSKLPPEAADVGWTGWTFSITTALSPSAIINAIHMPSMRVKRISLGSVGNEQNTWSIDGEVYAQK